MSGVGDLPHGATKGGGVDGNNQWGPYRQTIVEGVVSCADFLGRLERSLTGEAATDRRYFSEKALRLQETSRWLARLVRDVEVWLHACEVGLE